ncbi:acetyl ornithine aminotransferase family protein [bacterium]|nr:acetyl ornithine aminotransferase family protein [bacterium]
MSVIKRPILKTALPGPKARAIVKRDQQALSPSYTRDYPAVIERGQGVWLTDVDGNVLLDFCAGIAVNSTGHGHPRVVDAIKRQAEKFIHYSGTDFYYEPEVALAERLISVSPTGKDSRVFFSNSGAEAVEGALKLARYRTGRQQFIAFIGGFHGRTMGAVSCTGSKTTQKKGFFPTMPGVTHVPYPNCYRCVFNKTYPGCSLECVSYIEDTVLKTILPPEEVAGMVFEPVQGEGGYVVPPVEAVRALRKLCDKHGILLIADEIQSGMGRTGKWFAIEHAGVRPDIITVAKGIASGMPIGAIIAPAGVMSWKPGSHGSTYSGNPVCCAAGIATFDVIKGGLLRNAESVGGYLMAEFKRMQRKYDIIGDVRGRGLMIGVEIVESRRSRAKSHDKMEAVLQEAFRRGLLMLGCGTNTLRICPPLVITKDEAAAGVEIIEQCLRKAAGK